VKSRLDDAIYSLLFFRRFYLDEMVLISLIESLSLFCMLWFYLAFFGRSGWMMQFNFKFF
jgi:hypothetical protein